MCPVDYSIMTRSKNHCFDLRIHMVRLAIQDGVRSAARAFGTSRNTVRKWLSRFKIDGALGLSNRSRAPHGCPHKTPKHLENKIIAQRMKTPGFGPARLKYEFELPASTGAIARIIRQNNLKRPRKKKHQTKNDLRAVKALYKPFRRCQMDVKYLNDIPNYFPLMLGLNLPRFQYTIRCVKTGATFLAYGAEISKTYAEITVRRFLKHLQRFNIPMPEIVVQTDKGSEFDGQTIYSTDRGFTHAIELDFKAHHRLLMKTNPNANADVESFHFHEEPEFFNIESFENRDDFFRKITTYQNYWNLARLNFYKGGKKGITPLEVLTQHAPDISPEVLLLPPVDLDNLLASGVGHDVPELAGWWRQECAITAS